MDSLYANIINETEKMLLKKKTVFFIAAAAILPLAAMALIKLFQSKLGVFGFAPSSYPILILGIFTGILIPLFVFTAAADLFAGELGDNTLRITLTRPISRFKVFLSKNISIGIFTAIILSVVFITSSIAGLFLEGRASFTGFLESAPAYIAAAVPMIAMGVLAVFLSQFFKSASGALTACLLIYIAGKAMAFVAPRLARITPFSYTDWHMLWLGSSLGPARLLNIFMLILSYIIILFSVGYYLFDKKDL